MTAGSPTSPGPALRDGTTLSPARAAERVPAGGGSWRAKRDTEKPPFELIEEAFHLVRIAPMFALAAYFLGSLPFILALLYFWADMSRSAFAEQRLIPGVLGLTGLFAWMKAWQSVYCRQLLARLCGEPPPRWSLRAWLETAAYQTAVQPAGLFLLPFAMLTMIPLGWTYAFFSAATVVNGTGNPGLRAALARSWRQAMIWPLQNHYVLTLIVLFGFFVFVNILAALLGVPFLLKTLLGVESVFTRSPWAAFNSTLLMAQVALTYLCLDPVMKAAYVLRCFYAESLRTGQDLRAELNSLRPAAPSAVPALATLLAGVFLLIPTPAANAANAAAPLARETTAAASPASTLPPVTSDQLDRAIEHTIQKREYSWRLPPDSAELQSRDDSLMARLGRQIENGFKAMGRWVEDVVQWLFSKLRSSGGPAGVPGFASAMEIALVLLAALLLGVILWLLIRLWQNRPHLDRPVAAAVPAAPDLARDDVNAAELPEDGWLRMARELLAQGDSRLALRAFYLASLSHLGERHLITLARFKSNRDYERELHRRGHALGGLPGLFSENMAVFERAWYGSHPVLREHIDLFNANLERMKSFPAPVHSSNIRAAEYSTSPGPAPAGAGTGPPSGGGSWKGTG